ncbi:MAG: HAMP domain-containing sensor histidine kinase [Deltaproteobacteria bacterium]|jgi:signal transduction histidine kinase
MSGLGARVLIASTLSAIVATLLLAYLAREFVATVTLRAVAASRVETKKKNLEACERDPAGFVFREGPVEIFAYDAQTLEAVRPDAPPLDPDLLEQLRGGEPLPVRIYDGDEVWGGAVLDRVSGSGPCSLFQIRFKRRDGVRRTGYIRTFVAMGGIVLFAIGLTTVVAIRPTLQRLDRLAEAAQSVGDDRFRSADDDGKDAIGAVSGTLDAANARIVVANQERADRQRALREHLANVAHDLRTPLASAQLALEEALGLAAEDELQSTLLAVVDDLVYLDALTNNLHLASKLERVAGPLDSGQTIDLGRIVDFVLARFSVLGRRHGIEVTGARPDAATLVCCDPAMAQQAIANIVHNAIKYGRTGGHAAVVLAVEGDTFVVTVLDDGPGVAESELAALPARTFRTDRARSREGSGLGLAITAAVAERAGWRLTFAPNAPTGLQVQLRGPLARNT